MTYHLDAVVWWLSERLPSMGFLGHFSMLGSVARAVVHVTRAEPCIPYSTSTPQALFETAHFDNLLNVGPPSSRWN